MAGVRAAAIAIVLLLAAPAAAASWRVTRPVTGSPCASFEWEAFDPSGFRFYHALTEDSTTTIHQGDWPARVRCRCWDAAEPRRQGPWSDISDTFVPPGLMATWWEAGRRVGMAGLTMVVSFAYAVESAWPDSLR